MLRLEDTRIPAPSLPADAATCDARLNRLRCTRTTGHEHGHVFDAGDVADRHDREQEDPR